MPTQHYDKLVRDRIPEIIESKGGGKPVTRILDDVEFSTALRRKLVEEATELLSATSEASVREELADVYEVLLAIATDAVIPMEIILSTAARKREERGGFTERIFLASIERS